ncbi:MAG TPA: ADP-ribosylglycohydrolase family protein [Chthonomonadales bacterium]|nr:ADP-ribosylglycohydrolase family protein [Chthonomonadales bacterium]
MSLSLEQYQDRVLGGWLGKSAGVTLGAPMRGKLTPGRNNYYSPVPGQPVASMVLDFPLVWLQELERCGPEVTPEDLAVAWLEHLDYSQDELGYAALNLRRGLPPPASGAHSNWFKHSDCGLMRSDLWAMVAPGAPAAAASYAYHDSKLDHAEEGIWSAMFFAAFCSASFFLEDPLMLLAIGLAMIPRTCRTARAVKTALAAAQRAANWLEARESVQHEVGHSNFTDAPQNVGFFTIGLMYGMKDFGASLCAGANCGYDAETVGGMLGAALGLRYGAAAIPDQWKSPLGDVVIPGVGLRDLDVPASLTAVAQRTVETGLRFVAARCPDVQIGTAANEPPASPAAAETIPPDTTQQQVAAPPVANASATTQDAESPLVRAAAALSDAIDASERAGEEEPVPGSVADVSQPAAEASGDHAAGNETTPQADAQDGHSQSLSPAPAQFAPQPVAPDESALSTSQVSTAPAQPAPVPGPTPDVTGAISWTDNTAVKPLLVSPSYSVFTRAGTLEVVLDAGESPTIAYGQAKALTFTIMNRGDAPFSGRIALLTPSGWQSQGAQALGQRQYVAAHTGALRVEFVVRVAEGQGRIDIANAVTLRLTPETGAAADAEFLLLGASCWWTTGPFANFDGEGFDRSYPPEDRPGLHETYFGRIGQAMSWERQFYPESTLDLEPLFKGSSGVCFGQTTLVSPTTRDARLVANTNNGAKVWLNGALVLRRHNRELFRPQIGSGNWAANVTLNAGDNAILVKWVRGAEPYQFSLTVSDRFGRGLPEVGNTAR